MKKTIDDFITFIIDEPNTEFYFLSDNQIKIINGFDLNILITAISESHFAILYTAENHSKEITVEKTSIEKAMNRFIEKTEIAENSYLIEKIGLKKFFETKEKMLNFLMSQIENNINPFKSDSYYDGQDRQTFTITDKNFSSVGTIKGIKEKENSEKNPFSIFDIDFSFLTPEIDMEVNQATFYFNKKEAIKYNLIKSQQITNETSFLDTIIVNADLSKKYSKAIKAFELMTKLEEQDIKSKKHKI